MLLKELRVCKELGGIPEFLACCDEHRAPDHYSYGEVHQGMFASVIPSPASVPEPARDEPTFSVATPRGVTRDHRAVLPVRVHISRPD
jgi:hypothetical protein